MNRFFALSSLVIFLIAISCGVKSEKQIQSTTKATAAPPIPTPIKHEPYVIKDSSNVKTFEGGVKMYIIEEGTGPIPTATQKLVAHYHGMLTDGTVFDSSFDRGQTSEFGLNQVIKGWTVALTQARCGSMVKLVIPPAMGYGSNARPTIPANSTLIFDVHLMRTY